MVVGALLAAASRSRSRRWLRWVPRGRWIPIPGSRLDWTVLGLGVVALVTALSVIAVAIAYRQAPHRVARRSERTVPRRLAACARAAARSGLPTPVVTGIRFALEPGAGTHAVPVRSAILGAVLAMVVVVATVTFGASLNTLVSHPALYGWNWDYELLSGYGGQQELPQHQTASLLDHDPLRRGIDRRLLLRALGRRSGRARHRRRARSATVAPPFLSGHGFDAPDQVVLGATTLADLHKQVGDTVEVRATDSTPDSAIVGTATHARPSATPAISTRPWGRARCSSYKLIPATVRNAQHNEIPGPNAVLVRFRAGANTPRRCRSLQQINHTLRARPTARAAWRRCNDRPRSSTTAPSGNTPAYLGAALAVGAVVALALTLIASVRRRRRDLALLKTLGFTRRQLGAVVAWQSSVAVGDRRRRRCAARHRRRTMALEPLRARDPRGARARPSRLPIALIAIGALVLANLVAAIPARQAARTRRASCTAD